MNLRFVQFIFVIALVCSSNTNFVASYLLTYLVHGVESFLRI